MGENKSLSGNIAIFKISTTKFEDASDGLVVNGSNTGSWEEVVEVLEDTEFGATHANRLGGLLDTTMSLSGNYRIGSDGQDLIKPGRLVFVAYFPQGLEFGGMQCRFLIAKRDWTTAVDGKQEFSADFEGAGSPSEVPASF